MSDITEETFDPPAIAEGSGRHVRAVYRALKDGSLVHAPGHPTKATASAVHQWIGRSVKLAPKPARDPALDYKLTPADLAFIWRAYAELRDTAWVDACERARVKVAAPGLPPECRLDPTYYARFTQAQVYEFLKSATATRDLEWRCWADNPLYRAEFPAGPDQFTIADIATEIPNKKE